MTITVSGLGSGMDYDSWIEKLVAVKQADIDAVSSNIKTIQKSQTSLSSVKTDYQALQSAIKSFTTALSSDDVFNQKTATSSSDAVKASATSNALAQSLKISVSELATATTASSSYTAASYADASTKVTDVSNGSLTTGKFSIYVDGVKKEITVGSGTTDDTLGEIVTSIDNLTGVAASLNAEGKLTISAESGHSITVGSTSDTSNFTKVMSLTRDADTGVYSSSKSIFDTSTSALITNTTFRKSDGSDATVTTGKFIIGSTEITVGATDTLSSIIDKINKSSTGVTAAWDSNTGKIKLTANDEGAVGINIEAGTSNFTDVMGLTSGGALNTGSQTLGTNAVLTINGTTITSASNTVTSDISGIKGLTLTLNAKTTSDASVEITQDTTKITEAITNVVSKYNKVITDTDSATTTDGNLYGESILTSLRTKLRRFASSSIGGEETYKTLASIGITTGAVSTDTSAKTNTLKIDSTKLADALKTNPDAVKTLLAGDTDTEGILEQMGTVVDNALDTTKGYFVKRDKSYTSQVSRLNDKVTDMTTSLSEYKKQLETKFAALDKLIAGLQNQASVFDSYFNKKTSSNSKS